MILVHLSQIIGEHKVIEMLRRELKVSFSQQAACHFTENGLQLIAKCHPVWVTREGINFRCIGSLRYFHLFKAGLPSTARIPVVVLDRVKKKEIEELVRLELLLEPEIYLLTGNDRRHMWSQWRDEINAEFLTKNIKRPGLQTLARMLGCEVRTLNGARKNANTLTGEESGPTETA